MNGIDYEKLNKDIEKVAIEHGLSYMGMRHAVNKYFGIECTCGLKDVEHLPYCKLSKNNTTTTLLDNYKK